MQMSIFLALVQTLIGAATLGVALLALESGDPPHSDGHPRYRDVFGRPGPSGPSSLGEAHCSTDASSVARPSPRLRAQSPR